VRTSTSGDSYAERCGQPVQVHQEVGDAIVTALLPLLNRLVSLRDSGSGGATDSGGPSALSLAG